MKIELEKKDINIFDTYNFNHFVKRVSKNGTLEDCLKLLDIIKFEVSQEDRAVFEFTEGTMAIEVYLKERVIRFWGWIGNKPNGDYFWKYLSEEYPELFNRIIDLLVSKYFLFTTEFTTEITCEIVATIRTDIHSRWIIEI